MTTAAITPAIDAGPRHPFRFSMTRRAFLSAAVAAITYGLPPVPEAKALPAVRSLWVDIPSTGGRGAVTFAGPDGYDQEALARLDWALRDWRMRQFRPIDPRLYDALSWVQAKWAPDRPVVIHSGYRTPATNAMLREILPGVALHSQHIKGNAIDFHIPGVPIRTVADYMSEWNFGGVGRYADFVHIDTGNPGRRWARD